MKPITFSSMMSPVPSRFAIVPPITEPTTPRASVHNKPIFWRPGSSGRASAPMINPATMKPIMAPSYPRDTRTRPIRALRLCPAAWASWAAGEKEAYMAEPERQGAVGGITLGGIIVIVGIVLMIVWSFWIGLIITLVGLIAFGGFARGKWY